MIRRLTIIFFGTIILAGCGKDGGDTPPPTPPPPPPPPFQLTASLLEGTSITTVRYNTKVNTLIRFSFNAPVNRSLAPTNITVKNSDGNPANISLTYENGDSSVVIQPANRLDYITKYTASVSTGLKSSAGTALTDARSIEFVTVIDSSRKFPQITDDELLTKVQQQTFKYFWDFAHPVSGMARERSNGDNNVITSGGTGFGVLAILVGIERGFVSRGDGLARMQRIVSFLKNTAQTFHGAYPHWLNGSTGAVIPFSANDNGADLVETSYLIQGLLTARQYFNGVITSESDLRNDINIIWNRVEWNWFRRSGEQVLYWHWSPDKQWQMNVQIKGWNECLISYVLAASSPSYGIPKTVYDAGWASNGGIKNNNNYYGYTLPLGPEGGGPLFLSQYSFLGINPNNLQDQYAAYTTQTRNHSLINYSYCKTNPKNFFGYSDSVWGLTASDIKNGYHASSPTNDLGYIAPTAALSAFPFSPSESMKALKFYYYVLGNKIWKDYGFTDAFSLHHTWFADSFLAIDQGPIIVMIENYRTGLIWNLFTTCPEIKTGMTALGFTAPYL